MRSRIFLLALSVGLIGAEVAQAQQWGRGGYYGRGGTGYYSGYSPGFGISVGVGSPGYYGGYGSPYYNRGYYGSGYYGNNYNYRNGYYNSPSTYYYNTPSTSYYVPNTTFIAPATQYVTPASATVNAQTGMQITEVADGGGAKRANLRSGDIITWVGSNRVQTFEELQQALARSDGEVELTFLNGANMKSERTKVMPKDGKIGVSVVPVYVPN